METEHRITLARIAGSIVLLAVAHFEPGLTETCQIILYAAAYLVIGGDIVWNALRNVVRGEVFDENFLMAVATAGAFATGQYPEAVAVMLFYQIGEMFQDIAVDKSRKSITSLMDHPSGLCQSRNPRRRIYTCGSGCCAERKHNCRETR